LAFPVGEVINNYSDIVDHLGGAQKRIQMRQAAVFYEADEHYGRRVAEGLKLNVKEVKKLVSMSSDDRARGADK
jgi:catalase